MKLNNPGLTLHFYQLTLPVFSQSLFYFIPQDSHRQAGKASIPHPVSKQEPLLTAAAAPGGESGQEQVDDQKVARDLWARYFFWNRRRQRTLLTQPWGMWRGENPLENSSFILTQFRPEVFLTQFRPLISGEFLWQEMEELFRSFTFLPWPD